MINDILFSILFMSFKKSIVQQLKRVCTVHIISSLDVPIAIILDIKTIRTLNWLYFVPCTNGR